jgi:hypothetical protein
MEINVPKELAALQRMSVSQLREKYAEVFGEVTTTGNRTWLSRRIAWRIQPDVASRAMPATLVLNRTWGTTTTAWGAPRGSRTETIPSRREQ